MFLIVGCHDIILFKREHLTLTITVKPIYIYIYIYIHTYKTTHREVEGERKFIVLSSCALATSPDWTATKFKTTDTHRERGKKEEIIGRRLLSGHHVL